MTQRNEAYPKNAAELEAKLGYSFSDKELLLQALRHSSYSNEARTSSNERLEFLGDSVLSKIVSEYLYKTFPERNEGDLSNIRRQLIEQKTLATFARELEIGKYLFLGHGEENGGGRDLDSNLEDAFEAIVGAIYLDGGDASAEKFVLSIISDTAKEISSSKKLIDPKSLLQEIVQDTPGEKLEYVITGEEGPDHDKTFYCDVMVNSNVIGSGVGHSKKEAEKAAARKALKLFGATNFE
ncbi:MAG: ribonuclease III [Clostridia bacterium]|nr:ribonuclease III [Clostridia bacterium]